MRIWNFAKQKARILKDRRNFPLLLFAVIILFAFLANSLHEAYPDEMDNILGGWYILHGRNIYNGFFTHHGPFPYFLSAIVEILSGRSFPLFRIVYSVFLFIFTFWSFAYLRENVKRISLNFYYLFIVFFATGATYFWGHMALADNISAILLTPVFALMFLKIYTRESFLLKDFIFISILTFFALLSSLTYIYIYLAIYLILAFYYLQSFEFKLNRVLNKETYKIITIFALPFVIYLAYLLITGSLSDYLYQAVVFNKKYYVYYPGSHGEVTVNPIRFAIIIAQNFHNNFSSLMIQARDFNFSFPFNITLAIGNTALIIYLLLKRRFGLALLTFIFIAFANARSNPLVSSETDYQSAVYILISLFNLSFILPSLYNDLNREPKYGEKILLSFLFIVVSIYSFFNFTFLLRKFADKAYTKYMGFAPAIYDRPRIAPIINSLVDKNGYAWMGPFEFGELFYLNAKIPSKYHILLPGFGGSEKIQQEMLTEFNANKPDVIYFDSTFFILGKAPESYAHFFLNFLNNNYTNVADYPGKIKYKSKLGSDVHFNLETKLYMRRDKAPELIEKMTSQNLIERK